MSVISYPHLQDVPSNPGGAQKGEANRWLVHAYKAFGLDIASELELPELEGGHGERAQAQIRLGSVRRREGLAGSSGVRYEATTEAFYLEVEDVARYLVENGSTITIEPCPSMSTQVMRLFLLGSAIGSLLHQRGLLPLHASGVERGDRAVLFSGESRAGKSTTAAAFSRLGHRVLADDVSCVSFDEGPIVHQGVKRLKLWTDSTEHLGLEKEDLFAVHPDLENRHGLRLSAGRLPSLPVSALFFLVPSETTRTEIVRTRGVETFQTLARATYRFEFLQGLGCDVEHMRLLTLLAQAVPVFRVSRPVRGIDTRQLIDAVENALTEVALA